MNDSLYVERLFLPAVENHACQVPVTHWYTVFVCVCVCALYVQNSLVSIPFIFFVVVCRICTINLSLFSSQPLQLLSFHSPVLISW